MMCQVYSGTFWDYYPSMVFHSGVSDCQQCWLLCGPANGGASASGQLSGTMRPRRLAESFEFVQASGSDSEFEHADDDFVDEAEEGDIKSKVNQMGISVLNYNMLVAEKYREYCPSF